MPPPLQVGIRYDKLPGEWYGPTTAACVLRDISELYAARLSPAPLRNSEGTRGSPPPRELRSSHKSTHPNDAAATEGLGADSPTTTGGGGDGRGGVRGGGQERDERHRDSGSPPADGEDAKNGDYCGEGGAVFPSSRPLRVFVSQGDVVYIDEVEAMAVRGGDATAAAAAAAAKRPVVSTNGGAGAPESAGDAGDSAHGESNGVGDASPKQGKQRSDRTVGSGKGEGAPPAFFDPLLNPGSGGGLEPEEEAWSSAVVLLVPLRLGLDELSAGYIPSESQ